MWYLHIHFVCDKLCAFCAILFSFRFTLGLNTFIGKRPITRYIEKHSKVWTDSGMFSIYSCFEYFPPTVNKPLERPYLRGFPR